MTTLRRVRLGPQPAVPVERSLASPTPPAALTSRSKRALDVVAAMLLLALSSPIWLCAAVIIRLTSPGPILFRQQRIGVDGAPFTVLKFRTMHHGASDEAHRQLVTKMIREGGMADGTPYKLNGDKRIIEGVRWLRSTSLDELPQLVNVLRGEMSLVGPRPPLPYEVEHYEERQRERLSVRPGITGLWQVSGRNRLTFQEMCALDRAYIDNRSLWSDVKIMLMTPWVMFVDHGGAS
jgi:lipopolysaccharide/colanic/teichoic acid biosynthesis glycosyltransferase